MNEQVKIQVSYDPKLEKVVLMELDFGSRIKLNNGVRIPVLGLGVYLSPPGRVTQHSVDYALKSGYRLVDTAHFYRNERDVGKAVKQSGISREDVFITTKLWNDDHGYDSALHAFRRSLDELGMDYIDLYLIHWPVAGLRNESWKALTKLLKDKKTRAIGVSNYTIQHLKELLELSDIVPAINQVEFHPFLYQEDLLRFCREHNIQVEAYSPLARGHELRHPTLVAVARRYEKTTAQIMIRWGLQHGLVVIPKSVKEERIIENSKVFDFEISKKNMDLLDSLSEDLHTAWDPTGMP